MVILYRATRIKGASDRWYQLALPNCQGREMEVWLGVFGQDVETLLVTLTT